MKSNKCKNCGFDSGALIIGAEFDEEYKPKFCPECGYNLNKKIELITGNLDLFGLNNKLNEIINYLNNDKGE